jgi:hypothetical protein
MREAPVRLEAGGPGGFAKARRYEPVARSRSPCDRRRLWIIGTPELSGFAIAAGVWADWSPGRDRGLGWAGAKVMKFVPDPCSLFG